MREGVTAAIVLLWGAGCLVLSLTTAASAQPPTSPYFHSRIHYSGDIWLNIQAMGTIGSGPGCMDGACRYQNSAPAEDMNTLRIDWQPSFEYPGGSQTNYLYLAGLMFGCIKDGDTLVSTSFNSLNGFGSEFLAFTRIEETSWLSTSPHFDPAALADQEYRSTYSDTSAFAIAITPPDAIDQRPHKPIGLEVSQTSRSWSDGSARRFIIFDLWFKNISGGHLREPSVGITVWPGAGNYERPSGVAYGQMAGFLCEVPPRPDAPPGAIDTLNLMWYGHNSGAPNPGFTLYSPTAVVGYRILRAPPGKINFNWWNALPTAIWGPYRTENRFDHTTRDPYPDGDKSIYQLMTNGEVDYDNMYAALDYRSDGWAPPLADPFLARSFASGESGMFHHLSCGPFPDMAPGDSIPFTFAMVVGEKFHARPDNFARNFDPYNPGRYRDNLDFSDLIATARAADWHFDNPGVDTDGDGYAGKFYLEHCIGNDSARCDTVWYKGDGIPDWGGPKAPPPPQFEVTTMPEVVTLQWTSAATETARDPLSGQRDFEGYRVYSSRINIRDQYALISSWDIPDNFRRFAYDEGGGGWSQISYPLTIGQWRQELGDPEFDPEVYPHPSLAFAYKDTVTDTIRDASGNIIRVDSRLRYSYWVPQGPNFGNTYVDAGRVHMNLIQRIDIRDTIIGEDTLQYGVYEMTIDNLSPAIPLWFSVTTFDHGDYHLKTEPLESGKGTSAQFAFPVYSSDVVVDSGLKVHVYPNPYKIAFADAFGNTTNYYAQGYEAYGQPVMNERERRIWFANLPDTATIRIWSLDGDLIREIHHPDPFLTRYSSIVGWDLISRNTQAVVSGIYIWRVDSQLGSQIGKIVIIK